MDIGFGDIITPDPQELEYPLLLDDRKVFCYIKQTVSLNKTLCFIIENTLFPLTKQFVPLYENKLFFVVETKCFSMLEQTVQCCELTD